MIDKLKKLYKEHGKHMLPFMELCLMDDPVVDSKADYSLVEYRDMELLTFTELKGRFKVTIIKDSPKFTHSMKSSFKRPRLRRNYERVLDTLVGLFPLPSDLYINGTRAYSPKYVKFAKPVAEEYDPQGLADLYQWVNDSQEELPKKLEIMQLLNPLYLNELIRWREDGIPSRTRKSQESFAHRELE